MRKRKNASTPSANGTGHATTAGTTSPPTGGVAGVVGPLLDVTREDAEVWITSGRTGRQRRFRVRTNDEDSVFMPGKRMAAIYSEDQSYTTPFAFVGPDGIRVWQRYRSGDTAHPSKWEKYADMLERPSLYIEKGCQYDITITGSA